MAISRNQLLKELEPGLNELFGLEYAKYPDEHTELFEVTSTERAWEEETKLSGFGMAIQKSEGDGVEYDTAQEAFTARYNVLTYALAFAITEEAMEDNLYDSLSARYTKALARAMAYAKQVNTSNYVNNGFSASLGGDQVSLFNTSHPLVSGGVQSNRPTTGVDLNETAMEAADIQIAAWVDERGLLIAAKIKKLFIPKALEYTAARLLKTTNRVGTSDNDINALRALNTIPGNGYSINHWFTDTNAWFLTTDVPNGLKYFQRVKVSNKMEGDFDTGNVRYKARERYAIGHSDPLGIWGSPGSS
jgi:hypothetical protein